jgi:hypothetical protein
VDQEWGMQALYRHRWSLIISSPLHTGVRSLNFLGQKTISIGISCPSTDVYVMEDDHLRVRRRNGSSSVLRHVRGQVPTDR